MIYDYQTAVNLSMLKKRGFWQVGQKCFFNKIECLKYANKICNNQIRFHLFDEIYNSFDWKKEINDSIDDIYKQRAIQLRDNYRYLALAISGGADSTNMLMSFLKNNIKVDEIICSFPIKAIEKYIKNFDPRDDDPKNYMFEYTHAAYPLIKYVNTYYPGIKITVLDYIDETLEIIKNNEFHKFSQSGVLLSVATGWQYSIFSHLKNKNKAAIVYGIDKPRIRFNRENKKFESFFIDINGVYGHFDELNFEYVPQVEYFYYTPDMPQIVIKQSQLIKQYIENILLSKNIYQCKDLCLENPQGNKNLKIVFNVHSDPIKKILYKDWNTEVFQVKKIFSMYYSEVGYWFYKDNYIDDKIKKYHQGQLNEILHGVNYNFLTFDSTNRPSQLKVISTMSYDL